MSKVTLTTELPIPVAASSALARKPEVMRHVLRVYHLDIPERIEVGTQGSARFWWFGVIPAWTHYLTIKRLEPAEISTNEHGGPVHTWNHRLTFESIDERSCRYTDEIETDDGWRGLLTRAFVRLMFRHRHRRWRSLAQILQ